MSISFGVNWTKLVIVSLLMCLMFGFAALAQQTTQEKPLNEDAVAELVDGLSEVVSELVEDEDQATAIFDKWDAHEDLVGKTKTQILRLLFADVKSVATDKKTQDSIWAEWTKGNAQTTVTQPTPKPPITAKPVPTPTQISTQKCPDGKIKGSDGSCVQPVYAFKRDGITDEDIDELSRYHSWRIAYRTEVTTAWEKGVLDEFAFLKIYGGDFCVPIQKDVNSFKRGTNCGDNRGNQGFLYVHKYTSMEESAFFKIEDEGYSGAKLVIEGVLISNVINTGRGLDGESYNLRHVPYIGEKRAKDILNKFYIWRFEPTGDGYYYIKPYFDLRKLNASEISEKLQIRLNASEISEKQQIGKEEGEMFKRLTEEGYDFAIVAGDVADNNLYIQRPNGRDNAKWKLVPLGNNKFYIVDKKHGLAIVGGEKADGHLYHQAPNGRKNAIWNITLASGNLDIPKEIKVD